jgi:rsbT antagonist protein RsbS
MASTRDTGPPSPPSVSILRQGAYLIASIHTALDDGQLLRFQQDLVERIGRERARGVVVDVAALDVLDSFAAHTLRRIAGSARLRGARTVVVGIHPEVAIAMVQLGMDLDRVETALDLEEGLALLGGPLPGAGPGPTGAPSGAGATPRLHER